MGNPDPTQGPAARRDQPVTACGRGIPGDPAYYPRALHEGQVLYFCTQACLDAFRRDPQRFLEVHTSGEPK